MNCAHNQKIMIMPDIRINAEADSLHAESDSLHTMSDSLYTMNIYPNGKTKIATKSLPNAVYQNQKMKIIIAAFSKGNLGTATGILIAPGKLITVNHILPDNINPNLIEWRGEIHTPTEFIQFKLNFVMAGEKETLEDILLLEIDNEFMATVYEQTKNNPDHPYNIFTKKLTIVDSIFVKQIVYVSTINSASFSLSPIQNWFSVNLPVEIIDYTFQTNILSIVHTPYIADSLFIELFKPLFRMRLLLPDGSSGSPVFNEDGNLIGMIIATERANFSYALSSKTIKEFLYRASSIK